MDGRDFDLLVVGAGLVGLATAREFLQRHDGARVGVLEKEAEVAVHQSGHNSGVVHSGIYYAPGSLRAKLCVEGARRLSEYARARGLPYRRCGKVIVATREEELPRLHELLRRGNANGVAGLRLLDAAEIAQFEPHARGLAAIHSPATGIIDFRQVARALAADIAAAGGQVLTTTKVRGIRRRAGGWAVITTGDPLRAPAVITCGGLHADALARLTGGPAEPRIIPFRGEFWQLRPERRSLVRALIYPVPDPALPFLGVHFTRQLSDEVHLGPNAVLALAREGYRRWRVRGREVGGWLLWPGFWRMAARYWRTGLGEITRSLNQGALVKALQRYVPELRAADLVTGPTGVRAQAVSRAGRLLDDFVFSQEEGILHVRNAPSPAATACLSIATMVIDQFAARSSQ